MEPRRPFASASLAALRFLDIRLAGCDSPLPFLPLAAPEEEEAGPVAEARVAGSRVAEARGAGTRSADFGASDFRSAASQAARCLGAGLGFSLVWLILSRALTRVCDSLSSSSTGILSRPSSSRILLRRKET